MVRRSLYLCLVGLVLPCSLHGAELWNVVGGETSISFEQSALETLGIQVVSTNDRFGVDSALIGLSVRPDSSLTLSSVQGIFEGVGDGALLLDGGFEMQSRGQVLSLESIAIRPNVTETSISFLLSSVVGHDKVDWFELPNPKIGFDGSQFLLESGGLLATPALAEAMGNPKLVGYPMGYVRISSQIIWAGGDTPVDPNEVGATDDGGVAGGNNGTNCWNSGDPLIGPDVIVGDIIDVSNYASSGGIEAFALGTTSCNIGSSNLSWQASPDPDHPVIGQTIFKLKNNRLEQIGQGWLKHGFTALTQNVCGCGCSGQGGTVLGVGCSDPYCCGLNGDQGGLGSKADINPNLGTNLGTHDTSTGSSIHKRIQVAITDLETTAGVRYFGETQYMAADDSANNNHDNNCSYRELTLSGSGSAWSFALTGTTQREQQAIRIWKDVDPTVTETDVNIPSEGLLIIAAKATDLGGGFWHYEYAVQNVNSDRSVQAFSVPVDASATVQNIGFHDVAYHSGDPYSGTDWTGTFSGGTVSWATQTFAVNPNANALRWGTMYNFRFDVNRAPAGTNANVTLTLFKNPASVFASTVVPSSGPADCNGNTTSDTCDISCAAPGCSGMPNCGTSDDCNSNGVPDECETDCNSNGIPDDCDITNGTSNDCNTNNIPDECDTFPTTPITSIRVATGLSQPVFVGAPRGDSRLWIVEQTGAIKIFANGSVLATPYLNIAALTSQGGERGLLGLAFDPNFNTNGRFYVNYTNTAGNTVIARYNATGGNPANNTADAASAVILKTITQDFANHNGGCLQFGPDNFLYVGMGDGGSANDPNQRAQDINSLLGKMLRLDVNNSPTYVAAGNPFIGVAGADEIWAIGMRNPWRFSFDRTRGDMYIGDVGQDAHEEIDFQPAGLTGARNYGWRCMEGTSCTGLSGCTCNSGALTLPILDVAHATTPGVCSITGGYVYRGCAIPDLQGTYFYADYCADFIKSFRYSTGGGLTNHVDRTAELAPNAGAIAGIVSFGEDGDGELYYCSISNGGVYKIVPDTGPACGNGVVEAGEECEPPSTATCDASCQSIACVPASFSDTFETNLGWTVSTTASTGAWERANPVGTAAQSEDDHTASGTLCYVTGAAGGALGDNDIDNGTTTLTSPTLNLTGGGTISYWRWYSNAAGAAPNTETFRVDVSNNNGSSWVNVETIGPSGAGTSGGWIQHEFDVSTFVTPTNQVKVRFIAEDLPANLGSIVEAGVDDFAVTPTDCNNNCVADTTDISLGTSDDCNANGIPDECETGGAAKNYDISVSPVVSIPDGTGAFVSHTFNVPDSGIINDVNLGVILPHTWNGDLVVRVQHGATTVTVIDRPGLPASPDFGWDNDGFDIVLDDEATGGSIEDINVAGGVASPPSYVPNNPLSAFDGMDKQGAWIISAADFVGSDTGSIDHWSLSITNNGSNPCPPITDCNENGVDDEDDLTLGTSEDCNNNDIPDECDIADGTSEDCEGGPVGVASGGQVIISMFCFGCHNNQGQGGMGFPGPSLRNHSRVEIWNMLWPPTQHPGGAFAEFDDQDFADLEAFLADSGNSRGRPDRVPDECNTGLANCDNDSVTDACELEAGTQVDEDYNGIPDDCELCTSNGQCDDGEFCNGAETCNLGSGLCESGTPPCTAVQICDELANACITIPVLSCEMTSGDAAPGGQVTLELNLSGPIPSLRGYEVRLDMARTSGTGSVSTDCPDGIFIDEDRPDYIFAGETSFLAFSCPEDRAASAVFAGIPIAAGNYYLSEYTLNVSADAIPGSTFEISIMAKPDTFLRDSGDDPIAYAIAGTCSFSVSACPPPTVQSAGPRYINVVPALNPDPIALRVTGLPGDPQVGCVNMYVQADGTLGLSPVYQTQAAWGTVHVHGEEIIPSETYRLQADCGPSPGTTLSSLATASTWPWGDVNNSSVVDIDDILCVLNGFSGTFTLCTLQAVDLDGCEPDEIVNLDDILKVLAAFSGDPFPCAAPCP